MMFQARAYDTDRGDPVAVLVIRGAHDVSRVVSALATGRGNLETIGLGRSLASSMRRHNGGAAALQLLRDHGGEDLVDDDAVAAQDLERLDPAILAGPTYWQVARDLIALLHTTLLPELPEPFTLSDVARAITGHTANNTVGAPPRSADDRALNEQVFTALGEVSMCWSETPAGIFDSARAKRIGDRLLCVLRGVDMPWLKEDASAVLTAWRDVVGLVSGDDPPLSPRSIVDRVAALQRDGLPDRVGRVFRAPDGAIVLMAEDATEQDLADVPDGSVELHPDGAAMEAELADAVADLVRLGGQARGTMPQELDGNLFGRQTEDLAERLLALTGRPLHARSEGAALVAQERQRQIDEEGWTPEHDDDHAPGTLSTAAAVLAGALDSSCWPWQDTSPKLTPSNRPRELARAGALLVAELDRELRRARRAP